MIFDWETQEEKLLRSMKFSPKKKLEWLREMHEFMRLAYTKKRRDIFWKMRDGR